MTKKPINSMANSQGQISRCAICHAITNPEGEFGLLSNKVVLENFLVCKKHKETLMASCQKCGSQDTKFVSGTSKKTGKPWSGYDCQEPGCVGDTGYPTRTFAFQPKSRQNASNGPKTGSNSAPNPPGSSIEKKLDEILEILYENFGKKPEYHKDEDTPF